MRDEVLVIGGGPAGLATAIAAAQAGLAVEIAEPRAEFRWSGDAGRDEDAGRAEDAGIDKCCGEGLLPPAIAALEELGIARSLLAQHGEPFAGIQFLYGRHAASARFPQAPALGVRRTVLHRLLSRRAAALGVRWTQAPGRLELAGDGAAMVRMGALVRRPRWVVGADGAQSAVRAAAGLEPGSLVSRRYALRQHFELAAGVQASPFVDVYWTSGAQAYVTTVGSGRIGIAIVADEKLVAERTTAPGALSMGAALARFPALQKLLTGAVPVSTPRGALTVHRTLRRVQRGAVALVGDASGSVDAITGDGLALSFHQALALGRALQQQELSRYEQAHRRLSKNARGMSRALLLMSAYPVVTRVSMAALGHVPGLFTALLRHHTQLGSGASLPLVAATQPAG